MNPPAAAPETGTRFRLLRTLGAGAMGVVYEAVDEQRGAVVALKTLHRRDPEGLHRLKHEFRALADIAHPNLVALHELFAADEVWFFTMERVDGPSFLEWVRGAPVDDAGERISDDSTFEWEGDAALPAVEVARPAASAPPDLDRLREGFRQLAAGVAALHAADRLHRDLKPSNVRVTRDGRVVLLDFGLVTEARRAEGGPIAGSAAYMSPEQIDRRPLGPASDWYAFGTMLYEALTGVRPFVGTALRVMADKVDRDPAPPDALVAELPSDLVALCVALLDRDPARRPGAAEIARRLGGEAAGELPVAGFQGREAALAALRAAWEAARRGQAGIAVVRGRSGMGKTALVRRFLAGLEPGVNVLAGRCYERESVPFKALDSLVDDLAEHLGRDATALDGKDAKVLATLFPVLGRVPAIASLPDRDVPDPHERRMAGFAALDRVVRALAPAVLFVDDVHWGDVDSAAWLARLVDARAPLLLVMTCREEERPGPFLDALTAAVAEAHVPTTRVDLGDLDAPAAERIARELLPEADAARIAAIVRESGGNPLFVQELAALSGSAPTLDDAIRARAAALPAEARGLLDVLAIAGRPYAEGVLAAATGLDDPRSALALLRARRFARTSGDRAECLHDRIREAVVAGMGSAGRSTAHARLADALRGRDGDPEAIAVHLDGAGRRAEAAPYALRAADRALDQLAFDHAARLYRWTLALDPSLADRRLQRRLGDALSGARRATEAADAWLAAAEGAELDERVELRRLSAERLLVAGHVSRGHSVLATALRDLGMWRPGATWARVLDVLFRIARARFRGLAWKPRTTPLPEIERIRLDLCFGVMNALAPSDRLGSVEFQARYLELALAAGDPVRVARALLGEAVQAAFVGGDANRERADRLLAEVRAIAENAGDAELDGFERYCRGIVSYFGDQMHEADAHLGAAEEVFSTRCQSATWHLLRTRLTRIWTLFHAGQLRPMGELVVELLRDAEERQDAYAASAVVAETGFVTWLARDDADTASRLVDVCDRRLAKGRYDTAHFAVSNARVQIALYRGDAAAAAREADANERRFRWSLISQIRLSRVAFRTIHGRALCALAEADPSQAAALSRAGKMAEEIAREPLASASAQADVLRGRIAEVRGVGEEAVAAYDRAIAAYERVGYRLQALALRRHRARIVSDATTLAACDEQLAAQGVRVPGAYVAMLLGTRP